MMKNHFLAAVMAVIAGVSFTACDELQEIIDKVIEVNINAENDTFNADGQAVVKLSLNAPSNRDITVILGLSSEAEEGYTAVDSQALDFDLSVTIPAGTESLPITVKVKEDAEILENQEAVITIASATGATVGKDSIVYIKIPAKSYNSGDKEDDDKIYVSIAAENDVFDDNGEAMVKLSLNKASDKEVSVVLGVKSVVEEGYTAIDPMALAFVSTVTIEAGATEASVKIAVVLDYVQEGQEAAIVIAAANGAEVAEAAAVAYIKVPESQQNGDTHNLDWDVKYVGCEWIEGYYLYGQLEVFDVSNTDTRKFYLPILVDLDEEGDLAATIAANPDAFFASMQEEINGDIAEEMEAEDETLQEAIAELYYNELNDGTEVLFYGYPAGNYQFVVLPIDATGKLDKTYKAINFSKTEDAASIYPWHESYNKRDDWSVAWDGWVEGDEGDYYWLAGKAPGAAYVAVDSYTDDELAYYYDGNLADMYNYTASYLADYIAAGYSIEDLAYYEFVAEVAADGTFSDYLSTNDMTGETKVYIIAFDATGKILGDYGMSVVNIPEYVPEPINWVERTDWAANFDATVDTGEPDYPDAIVTTVCDADYFVTKLFKEGYLESAGIEAIGQEAAGLIQKYLGWGYSMDELVNEYGVVHDSVPAVDAWAGLYDGVEIVVIGLNEDGSATGEWHMEVLTGYQSQPKDLPDMTLVETWSVTPVGNVYLDSDGYDVVDVEVNAPDILWYYIEENSEEDLEEYYDGDIANLAYSVEKSLSKYLGDYTMDDLLCSNSAPETSIDVYNANVPTSIYILEFDENGKATGRYGKSDVTIVYTEAEASAPAKAKATVHKDTLKVKKTAVKAAPVTKNVTLVRKHAGQKRVQTSLEISAKNVKAAKPGKAVKKNAR